eukprot:1000230-Karenia_brevis.AAC.1
MHKEETPTLTPVRASLIPTAGPGARGSGSTVRPSVAILFPQYYFSVAPIEVATYLTTERTRSTFGLDELCS